MARRRHKIHLVNDALAGRPLLRLAKLHSTVVADKRILDANYDYSRRRRRRRRIISSSLSRSLEQCATAFHTEVLSLPSPPTGSHLLTVFGPGGVLIATNVVRWLLVVVRNPKKSLRLCQCAGDRN